MPPCNGVTHHKKAQVDSNHKTSEGHRADIPVTKHLSRRYTFRTGSNHKVIHDY